jgi:predicted transcriptional regulator
MSEEIDELEKIISSKNEEAFISFTLNHSNEQLVKLRTDYQPKFSRDFLKDLESNFSGDFLNVMIGLYKTPVEYDADLLYQAMKGLGSDKDIISEVLSFRTPERINEIKIKFQEKYGKDLVEEIKSETSGDYQKIVLRLLEGNRNINSSPNLENCTKIAKEIYEAVEGKLGTNEDIFINYITSLSKEELLYVCKEYHRNYKKLMLDVIDNEFSSNVKDLLKFILYSIFSPSEFFAIQIHNSVVGLGTSDSKLIRTIISRADVDMKKIKKYYKKLYSKDMIEEVKDDISGSYQKIIEGLINK